MKQSASGVAVGETAAQWEQRLRQHPELLPPIVALLGIVEAHGQVSIRYGASLGRVLEVGALWEQTALAAHVESGGVRAAAVARAREESLTPVRDCVRYLQARREQLDYAGALAAGCRLAVG